ncbi:YeeE/YedE family protein [Solimonas marina]|uniref:YeeE/YedE family protein n=1 Tax=Solimonas marina TaxID=2714601 RepID=A0A970B6F2_9GAMM|nr:YeeE/YedE family protein [Solimonas marina]NKF22565.1 YeeE/YedE family protein [Solimonas marina]
MDVVVDVHSWLLSLIGGLLIGLAATVLLLGSGRIAGISGIAGGLLFERGGDRGWRALFVVGLIAGAGLVALIKPGLAAAAPSVGVPWLIGAGLLVGFGTRLGSGCTSGHGICGISRMSPRSLIATATFMVAGFVTVYVVRHLLGDAP